MLLYCGSQSKLLVLSCVGCSLTSPNLMNTRLAVQPWLTKIINSSFFLLAALQSEDLKEGKGSLRRPGKHQESSLLMAICAFWPTKVGFFTCDPALQLELLFWWWVRVMGQAEFTSSLHPSGTLGQDDSNFRLFGQHRQEIFSLDLTVTNTTDRSLSNSLEAAFF